MDIAVLGTGSVGRTLAARLEGLGHRVVVGTRDPDAALARTQPEGSESFAQWCEEHPSIGVATFADAAARGELVINATAGNASVQAVEAAGADHLDGKVLIDVSNSLDHSSGFPPSLSVSNTDSLGEQIQRALPGARVVKTLNTVNASVMVDPARLGGGDHTIFMSGNDAAAKATVSDLLRSFGWTDIVDLGDITTARGPEMYLPLWLRVMGALGTPTTNVKLVR